MLTVTAAEAAAIRTAWIEGGELAAAIEVRRLRKDVRDMAGALACARTIAARPPRLPPPAPAGAIKPPKPPKQPRGRTPITVQLRRDAWRTMDVLESEIRRAAVLAASRRVPARVLRDDLQRWADTLAALLVRAGLRP